MFFFFNDTATTEIYTLSLHDALPILVAAEYLDVRVADSGHPHAEERPARPELGRRLHEQTQISFFNLKCEQRRYALLLPVCPYPDSLIITRDTLVARLLQRAYAALRNSSTSLCSL